MLTLIPGLNPREAKVDFKHLENHNNHNFKRKNFQLLIDGWKDLVKGMGKIDQAILTEMSSIRKEDEDAADEEG